MPGMRRVKGCWYRRGRIEQLYEVAPDWDKHIRKHVYRLGQNERKVSPGHKSSDTANDRMIDKAGLLRHQALP